MARLSVGDTAPGFTLPDADGNPVVLADKLAAADNGVVVYFYPKASSPGCTTEACDFRDSLASLASAGYTVFGISADDRAAIKTFATEEHLTFPLLSDEDHAVAEAYGAWGPMTFGGNTFDAVHRCTFVVGPDGVLTHAEYDVAAEGHVTALRAQLVGS